MFSLYLPTTVHLYVINAARAFTSSTPIDLLKWTPGRGETGKGESLPFYHKRHRAIAGKALTLLEQQQPVTIGGPQSFG